MVPHYWRFVHFLITLWSESSANTTFIDRKVSLVTHMYNLNIACHAINNNYKIINHEIKYKTFGSYYLMRFFVSFYQTWNDDIFIRYSGIIHLLMQLMIHLLNN